MVVPVGRGPVVLLMVVVPVSGVMPVGLGNIEKPVGAVEAAAMDRER